MSRIRHRYFLTVLFACVCLLAAPFLPGDNAPAQSARAAMKLPTGYVNSQAEIPAACSAAVGTPIEECEKDQHGNITIGSGAQKCTGSVVIARKNFRAGIITIKSGGKLIIDDETANKLKPEIETRGININGGSLIIGDPTCPIGWESHEDKVTILFTGPKPTTCGTPDNNPASECPGWEKGIQVDANGTLRMYGIKGVKSQKGENWTYLSKPAGPSRYNASDKDYIGKDYIGNVLKPVTDPANVIHVAADVTASKARWQDGDWIAIATTSFSPWETEFVKIKSITKEGSGAEITLHQHLHYYHFGGPDPAAACDPPGAPCDANYDAGPDLNYGVDERAEVGLISRNILLTSDSDTAKENKAHESRHWGGEIRILKGFAAVSIQGVELQKFGKQQLGSYPIHFHRAGNLSGYDPADKLIDSNSIDHSYNKCITIHSTQNVTLSNNVCARITGQIFYEEYGDESNVTFLHNLGMGAMSNSFDINGANAEARHRLIERYYWVGDHMAKAGVPLEVMRPDNIGFNQFDIFDTDDQTDPVHGQCGSVQFDGKINLEGYGALPNCAPPKVYFEPPSGFWITNPSAKLIGNAIAGCQDTGKAYFYVPPRSTVNGVDGRFIPIGSQYSGNDPKMYGVFKDNRGSACYSGLYDDPEVISSDQLFGYQNGIHAVGNEAVVDEFDGVTLSRIRDRGVWIRPSFYVVKDARIAMARDGVSLVTSGGVDGNYPGVWGLLTHSTIVGISQNNVDRWGPCGPKVNEVGIGQLRGGSWGCIDQTNPGNPGNCCDATRKDRERECQPEQPLCHAVTGGEFTERGYPTPDWPLYGFLIYDGPPLILHDRFVNFRVSPGDIASDSQFPAAKLLDGTDEKTLETWGFYGIPGNPPPPPYTKYEGDAALGWFNANQSSYPAASTTDQLTFTNVDLRHQVYTSQVNRGEFTDGDENTTILDLDGSLAGVLAVDAVTGEELPSISLNDLGINASGNSVDECLAEGAEDKLREDRPTAAMEPNALGQLEFEMLYPPYTDINAFGHTETVTFAKDSPDFTSLGGSFSNYHGKMALKSRNGLGDWEPKVTNGYGYTVTAGTYTAPNGQVAPPPPTLPGIAKTVDVTLTDIVNDPEISSAHPFYVQLGICYTKPDGTHPTNSFIITRGFRSYGGNAGNIIANDPALTKYWNKLACDSLDYQQVQPETNIMPSFCPAVSASDSPVVTLTKVDSMAQMTTNGKLNGPPSLDDYYYDKDNGWLFLWIRQNEPNAQGPSPLGNCTGDKATDPIYCPSQTTGESYYVCPAEGCSSYRIVVNDPNYSPGPSACGDPYSAAEGYSWPEGPTNQNELVVAPIADPNNPVVVEQSAQPGKDGKFPHYASGTTLTCDTTSR